MLHFINGLCTVVAVLISTVAIGKHLKNYRNPMDQRLVVRILAMVPLFSVSAFVNLYCPWPILAHALKLIREIYEAFVIYTFYSLLTNLLGGEREIIYTKTGDPPAYYLGLKIDISDPHTFWVVKWLIMQYVWVRPLVVVISPFVTNRWLSWGLFLLFNLSITLALNALSAFWVCLRANLKPYRVVLKFLSVKLIVFFSYWQVIALKVASAYNVIPESQLPVWVNSLMCIECVAFAVFHWYAFPSSDYEATFMFGFARMQIRMAARDVAGVADLIHDFRSTFLYPKYGPRDFDSVEAVLDHPESHTRQKRIAAGLRYKNAGKSKYWLPNKSLNTFHSRYNTYGAADQPPLPHTAEIAEVTPPPDEPELNMEDEYSSGEEDLYEIARGTYGDYNYPVVVVQDSEEYVSFQERLRRQTVINSE